MTDPPSGAVVGGPNVHLAATALDLGSGVGSVRFEQRPAGGGSFTAIGTDTTDPYEASWDTTGLSGDYELRAVATDAAGNPGNSAVVPVAVDATAPSVTLVDPGALLRDVVNLAASTQSVAVASVAFDRRPSGGGSWTRIQLDATRPWGAAFDTKGVADGLYELRAQALDSTGHVLASHSRDGIRIDNTAPRVQSATPADGAVVGAAKSIVLVASEPVASIQGASLDGAAATATISGSTVTFSTGPLGAGEHALTGSLVDAAGNNGSFSVHFRIVVEAHAMVVLRVNRPNALSHGTQRVFVVPLVLSAPAAVKATLFSPTGRKLRTLRTNLSAGRHSLRFSIPAASLPPGRYTIVVVATTPDGSRVVRRVQVTIGGKRPAEHKAQPSRSHPQAIAISATPPPPPSASADRGSKPPATARPHEAKPKPKAARLASTPLETATAIVHAKSTRTIGFLLVLLLLGGAIAFLIKLEMKRLLASPRRTDD